MLPPLARWARVMRAGGSGWPAGLSRPLASAGIMLRDAMGESACAVAGPRRELAGCHPRVRAGPSGTWGVPGRGPHCGHPAVPAGSHPGGGLGPARNQPGGVPGLYYPAAWDGPLWAFPAGACGLLAALQAFFPLEAAPLVDLPGDGDGPEPQAGDPDLGLQLDVDEDDEYLLN